MIVVADKEEEVEEVHNIVERRAVMNTRGFQLPVCNTEKYQHSFFVQTVMDWNHLGLYRGGYRQSRLCQRIHISAVQINIACSLSTNSKSF